MFTQFDEKERGQSIVIIAFIVVILLALVALVVDVGNAYAQRRIVQNAVDAAAMAGVRELMDYDPENIDDPVTVGDVDDAVKDFAEENGLARSAVTGYLLDETGAQIMVLGPSDDPPLPNARGVQVFGNLPFNTYFAHLIGFETMEAAADAKGFVLRGACDGDNLFPVALSMNTFQDEPGDVPVREKEYMMWDKDDKLAPGNFGWVYWKDWKDGVETVRGTEPPQQNSNTTNLAANIVDTSRSGYWSFGDWVNGNTGVSMQPVLAEIGARLASDDTATVVIPLYGGAHDKGGDNFRYQIQAFGAFRLTCAYNAKKQYVERQTGDCDGCKIDPETGEEDSNVKCIRGYFVELVQPRITDGCADTGIEAPSFRMPKPTP